MTRRSLLFVCLLLGCGADSLDASGAWSGLWTSSRGVGGGLTLNLTDNNGALSGSAVFSGSPCFSAGSFTGSRAGASLTGTFTVGGASIYLTGSVSASSISGSYRVGLAGACSGDQGSFNVNR